MHTDDELYKNCKEAILEFDWFPMDLADQDEAEEVYDRMLHDPDFASYTPKPQYVHCGPVQKICVSASAYAHAQSQLLNRLDMLRRQTAELQAYLDTMPSWEQIEKTEKDNG